MKETLRHIFLTESSVKAKGNQASERISSTMYAARLLAFFSVCCAHTYYQSFAGTPHLMNLLYQFGTVGVAVFFFISGYYFKKQKPMHFVRKKVRYILIPWIFWGCAAYMTRFWDNCSFYFNPLEILRWLSGVGTYLWFLTVLMCLYIIFTLLPNSKTAFIVLVSITVCSRIATSAGLWSLLFGEKYNYYLNPLNWVGFFALGRYVYTKKHLLLQLKIHEKFVLPVCLSVSIFCGILDPTPTYAGWTNLLIQLLMIPVILLAADYLKKIKMFVLFGQYSLCLYLIHMPVIGKMNTIFQGSRLYALSKPILVTLCLSGLIVIGYEISKKIRLNQVYCLLTGIKDKK